MSKSWRSVTGSDLSRDISLWDFLWQLPVWCGIYFWPELKAFYCGLTWGSADVFWRFWLRQGCEIAAASSFKQLARSWVNKILREACFRAALHKLSFSQCFSAGVRASLKHRTVSKVCLRARLNFEVQGKPQSWVYRQRRGENYDGFACRAKVSGARQGWVAFEMFKCGDLCTPLGVPCL